MPTPVDPTELIQLTRSFAETFTEQSQVEKNKFFELARNPQTEMFKDNSIECTASRSGGSVRPGVIHYECSDVNNPSVSAKVSLHAMKPLLDSMIHGFSRR